MNIKEFNFPTFEEWNNIGRGYGGCDCEKRNYQASLGDFNLHIRASGWCTPTDGSSSYTEYQIAISTSHNPLNIYSETIFNKYHKYYSQNEFKDRDLQYWYEDVTCKANEAFKKYIVETYCVE